jgi:hypothetical protein
VGQAPQERPQQPAVSAAADRHLGGREHQVHRSETAGEAGGGAARRSYRIHYQTAGGDGHLILPHGPGVAADIVAHAEALLQQRGISARIRRIVPVTS